MTLGEYDRVLVGDFNGDGLDDLATYRSDTGTWKVSASTGASLQTTVTWQEGMAAGSDRIFAGDLNEDGRTDVVAVNAAGEARVGISLGDAFQNMGIQGSSVGEGADQLLIGDMDGDCAPDLVAFTAADGDPDDLTAAAWRVARYNGVAFAAEEDWEIVAGELGGDTGCTSGGDEDDSQEGGDGDSAARRFDLNILRPIQWETIMPSREGEQ